MQLTLTPGLETFIRDEVSSGRYRSASEVVEDALALLRDTIQTDDAWREQFNAKIDRGLAQLARGEGIPGEESLQRVKARLAERNRGS